MPKASAGSSPFLQTFCLACGDTTRVGVQIGARGQQDVEHHGTAGVDDRRRIEWADWFVDLRLDLGMRFQELADLVGVIDLKCLPDLLDRIGCS